ncbi:MAG: hypothetical protein ABI212_00025 [Burkholderiaceae bacterium]
MTAEAAAAAPLGDYVIGSSISQSSRSTTCWMPATGCESMC